jgi:hypothetical protein
LASVDDFEGTYSKEKLYEKLYKTIQRFAAVIKIEEFPNYKLKRNKDLLDNIINT